MTAWFWYSVLFLGLVELLIPAILFGVFCRQRPQKRSNVRFITRGREAGKAL